MFAVGTDARQVATGQVSGMRPYYCTGLFLRGQPPLLQHQEQLNVVVELPAPPHPPPGRGKPARGCPEPYGLCAVASNIRPKGQGHLRARTSPSRRGEGGCWDGPLHRGPFESAPTQRAGTAPEGQGQICPASAEQTLPAPRGTRTGLPKHPAPSSPAKEWRAGGKGELGWGAAFLPTTGEPGWPRGPWRPSRKVHRFVHSLQIRAQKRK